MQPVLPIARQELDAITSGQQAAVRAIRPWRVLHASERATPVTSVLEIQTAAGMRPSLLLPSGLLKPGDWLQEDPGEPAVPRSFLGAWHDVRHWRRCILEADPQRQSEIVHAHSFAAGMAAVRNCAAVVYDLIGFMEEATNGTGQTESYSWRGRSLRVAEQFVLTRAGAVIVHTCEAYSGALRRGMAQGNVFLIEPLLAAASAAEKYDVAYRHAFARRRGGDSQVLGSNLQPITACL